MSKSKEDVGAEQENELGSGGRDFYNGLITQLANVSAAPGGKLDSLTFMLSVVKGVKPRDQLEAMLAAQMAAVHIASMTFAQRLASVENIPQQDSAERAFNKLTRTYAMQMEALKRYRTGGEQKMTIQHVTVSEGGQAIVGNVTQTPRKNRPAVTNARTEAMPILSKRTEVVPMRSGSRK